MPFGSLHPEPERTSEPILGLRSWRVHRNRDGLLRLSPATPRPDWEPGVAQRASCSGSHTRLYMVFNPELAATHRSPEPGCTCGFYAVKEAVRLGRGGRSAAVVGQVSMWGRVIEHRHGWRAEFVYPARLRLVCGPCLWRGRLPARPDVALERRDGRLWPLCHRHASAPYVIGAERAAEAILDELLATYGVEVLPEEAMLPVSGRVGGDLLTRLIRALDPER